MCISSAAVRRFPASPADCLAGVFVAGAWCRIVGADVVDVAVWVVPAAGSRRTAPPLGGPALGPLDHCPDGQRAHLAPLPVQQRHHGTVGAHHHPGGTCRRRRRISLQLGSLLALQRHVRCTYRLAHPPYRRLTHRHP